MAEVVARFEVEASAELRFQLDTSDMDPDLLACYLLEDVDVHASIDGEAAALVDAGSCLELTSFTWAGRRYTRDAETGHWVVAG